MLQIPKKVVKENKREDKKVVVKEDKILKLQVELKKAIEIEDYEKAVEIRDRIREEGKN